MAKNQCYAVSFKDTNFHINASSCACSVFNICIANCLLSFAG